MLSFHLSQFCWANGRLHSDHTHCSTRHHTRHWVLHADDWVACGPQAMGLLSGYSCTDPDPARVVNGRSRVSSNASQQCSVHGYIALPNSALVLLLTRELPCGGPQIPVNFEHLLYRGSDRAVVMVPPEHTRLGLCIPLAIVSSTATSASRRRHILPASEMQQMGTAAVGGPPSHAAVPCVPAEH